jgi:hypothetical protein
MSSTITTRLDESQDSEDGSAGVARSEPGGRGMQGMAFEIGGGSPDLGP